MSKLREKKHFVEELHRGKWQPLQADNGKQKVVMITEETAERMNMYANEERLRYVLKAEKAEETPVAEIEVNDEEVVEDKPNKGGRPKKK